MKETPVEETPAEEKPMTPGEVKGCVAVVVVVLFIVAVFVKTSLDVDARVEGSRKRAVAAHQTANLLDRWDPRKKSYDPGDLDPWGNSYRFEILPIGARECRSAGPDREWFTIDDIYTQKVPH